MSNEVKANSNLSEPYANPLDSTFPIPKQIVEVVQPISILTAQLDSMDGSHSDSPTSEAK